MKREMLKKLNLKLRKGRIRSTVTGNTERPRLSVRISNRHIHCQIIDDSKQATLLGVSTIGMPEGSTMTTKAEKLGQELAKKAKKAKISKIVLDRNGKKYHGRIKALAEALRKEGMEL
jgi:large subunit ribosomal protein L18